MVEPLYVTKGMYFHTLVIQSNLVTFIYRALSHAELLSLNNLAASKKINEYLIRVVKCSLIEIECATQVSIDDFSTKQIKELAGAILKVSTLTPKLLDVLGTSVKITFSDSFSSDNWDCEVCKKRGLDKTRNCGYLGEKEKSQDFRIDVGKTIYTYCPMYEVDETILSRAVECYTIHDANLLPDTGGFYDQTTFFVTASKIVSNAIKEKEAAALKKMKQSKK